MTRRWPGLAGSPSAIPFVEAVVTQLTGPAGALRDAGEAERARLRERVEAVVLGARASSDPLVAELVLDPPLASALFQNIDLLHLHHDPHADAVSLLLLRVIHAAPAETARES